jgi:copper chaperone CopZ
MVETYHVTGMHCNSCVEKVESAIAKIPDIESVKVTLEGSQAFVTMNSRVSLAQLNSALNGVGSYKLSQSVPSFPSSAQIAISNDSKKNTIRIYYPLMLVFSFLLTITTISTLKSSNPAVSLWMSTFMAAFFIAFSFFKLLDIKGFATSYSSYDIITKRWSAFGYLYPFIELVLGIGYLLVPMNLTLNIFTALLMSLSIVGVIESVVNKRKIQCACLGTVFNLPMGTITIIEDALMIAMSLAMIGIVI